MSSKEITIDSSRIIRLWLKKIYLLAAIQETNSVEVPLNKFKQINILFSGLIKHLMDLNRWDLA